MEFEERRHNFQDLGTIIGLINNRFDDLSSNFNSIKENLQDVNERVAKVDYQLNNGIKATTIRNSEDIRDLNEKFNTHLVENTEKIQELQEAITDNIIEKLTDKGYLKKPVPFSRSVSKIFAASATVATIIGTVIAVWQYYHP